MTEASFKTGFPDLPIDPLRDDGSDNQDLLGLEPHADALASFIGMCSTPMTIGVQGDWGSGKTSLMNLVRAKLGDTRVLNIWFNTWQYAQFGNEEQLASSMLVNLMQKMKAKGAPSKQVWHNVSRFIRTVVRSSTIGAGTIDGKALSDAWEGRGELDDAGLFEQIKEDFAEVVKDILANERQDFERVVVYIDDLDRLAPGKAVELLEAVKNLIDVKGCVFVLAIDYDVVIRGLRQRKDYSSEEFRESDGRNFFDKIIQVPYRMPVERYKTKNFLRNHFERVYGELSDHAINFFEESSAELIRLSVGNNPRGLKRALNIHSLFSHLARVGRDTEEIDDIERVVTLVLACIQVAMPQMYSLLAKRDNPFRTLVMLCERQTFDLLGQSPEAIEIFERVALHVDQTVTRMLGQGSGDDDDEISPGLVAELQGLVGDLDRLELQDAGKQRRIQGLAAIALQAIDVDGDGVYSTHELDVLDAALSVTSTTSVQVVDVQEATADTEEEVAPVRRHVGFKEMSETMSVLARHPHVIFWDPVTEEFDENFTRTPDYDNDISRFEFIVDGESVRIKDETLRVLELREERGIREMTQTERRGSISAPRYWVVAGDSQERSLDILRDEWRSGRSSDINTRSSAGREAFDARILSYLRSRPDEYVQAREVQEQVGGTPTQVRTALNRLIEEGLATFTGRARGTRYMAL